MAGAHGGPRPGSGRKPKAVRFASKIARADRALARHLNRAVENLIRLADGGTESVERKLVPAGLVYVEYDEISDKLDKFGKRIPGQVTKSRVRRLAFPDLDPLEPVEVERKVTVLGPDRAANVQILDRILGRPRAEDAPKDAGFDLATLARAGLEAALARRREREADGQGQGQGQGQGR